MTRASKKPDRVDSWLADRWEQRQQTRVLVAWICWWLLGLAASIGLYFQPSFPLWHFLIAMVVVTTVTGWRASVRRTDALEKH